MNYSYPQMKRDIEMENKIYHLEQLTKNHLHCPKCQRIMNLLREETHLVGCMEYNIYICDWCRILYIQYPHESTGKENKIIEL